MTLAGLAVEGPDPVSEVKVPCCAVRLYYIIVLYLITTRIKYPLWIATTAATNVADQTTENISRDIKVRTIQDFRRKL